ncbi:MAG TPA: hypothetical protein VJ485_00415 [archaeon]|nr:hypothetical protein [archaeon]
MAKNEYVGKTIPVKLLEMRLWNLRKELENSRNNGNYEAILQEYQSRLDSFIKAADKLEPGIGQSISKKYQIVP